MGSVSSEIGFATYVFGLDESARLALVPVLESVMKRAGYRCLTLVSLYHWSGSINASSEGTLFVVLGCGLVLLYAPAPGEAGIDDVLAYLVEGHEPQIWRELQAHYRHQTQALTFSPVYLGMLPHMAAALEPGKAVTFDIAKQEITQRQTLRHPSVCRGPERTSGDERHARKLISQRVDGSLRCGLPEHIQGLADPFLGVVKQETTYFNSTGMLQHITRVRQQGETSGGRSTHRHAAVVLSYCEAVERFQAARSWPRQTVRATYAEVAGNAIDPVRLFYRTPWAGSTRPRYHEHFAMEWAWADHLSGGGRVLVPAGEVSYGSSPNSETLLFPSTTSGVALGGSYEEALLYGLFELIERDSFLTAWRLRRPCRPLDPNTLGDQNFQILLAAVARGNPHYAFHFFDTSTDTLLPSVWVMAVRREPGAGMKTLSAASCRLTFKAAMASALGELAGLMSFNKDYEAKRPHFRRCLEDPGLVHAVEEHAGLYGLNETFERFSFLDFENPGDPVLENDFDFFTPGKNRYDLKEILERLVENLHGKGIEVVARDLTFPEFVRRRLFCVKTAGTGLLPLTFSRAFTRFDTTPRLQRLSREWGLAPLTMETANLALHPLG